MKKLIDERLLRRCGKLLCENGWRLACVESMTSGFLSSVYAMEVNSGDYFLGSIVCYEDCVKQDLLAVPSTKLDKYCAESAVATLRILDGVRHLLPQAEVHISVTGLAYETQNPKQKRPIGTVYYAFALKSEKIIFRKKFNGSAAEIIIATCNSLLADLYDWLSFQSEARVEKQRFQAKQNAKKGG